MDESMRLTELTVTLVSAFVRKNSVRADDMVGMIQTTHAALAKLDRPAHPEVAEEAPKAEYVPAVSVRKSLASRDVLISLIDGKPYKNLKRHLTGHGLTPVEYRERYGLKPDYPMVAPSYSERRREIANALGLGRKRTGGTASAQSSGAPAEALSTPKRRGRLAKGNGSSKTLSLGDALKRSRARLSGDGAGEPGKAE